MNYKRQYFSGTVRRFAGQRYTNTIYCFIYEILNVYLGIEFIYFMSLGSIVNQPFNRIEMN